jgi:hypothetical protein
MYLTAQRVFSKDGQEGINSFYYLHRPHKQPKPTTPADLVSVAENNTGKLLVNVSLPEVKPGGNRVKSYLDIVAHDDVDEKALHIALNKFKTEIEETKMGPIFFFYGSIGFRFNTETSMYKILKDEYVTLENKALLLFRKVHK